MLACTHVSLYTCSCLYMHVIFMQAHTCLDAYKHMSTVGMDLLCEILSMYVHIYMCAQTYLSPMCICINTYMYVS